MQKAFAEILGSSTDERQALYSAVAANAAASASQHAGSGRAAGEP